jgi:radical SAM superfamily enzyme YgiQ (UPF0313 family)
MYVLLVHPSVYLKDPHGGLHKFETPVPPPGLAYIAAVLEKNDVDVEIIDDNLVKTGVDGILEKIKNKSPDIVGITCLTPAAPTVYEIAKKIKEYSSRIVVVLGNIHANVFVESILREGVADIVVHGEGEYTMLEIAKSIEENKSLERVKGISFLENGRVICTPRRPFIENLDELPYPAWHLFPPLKKYKPVPFGAIENPALPIVGSRGCPYGCAFCSLSHMGKEYRTRSVKNVVSEIEYLISRFGVKQLIFVDEIFPMHKKYGVEFCDEMISRGLNKKIVWITNTRVDLVDRELLQKMKEAGCRRIIYGFESGVQMLLDNVKKGFTLEDSRRAMKYTKEADIESVGLFMLGLPGETKELSQQTINFAKELDVDFAKFPLTLPYPGSELYETLLKEGKPRTDDWGGFTTYPSISNLVWIPDGMSGEELIEMQRKGMYDFYMRPKIIFRHLFKIRTTGISDLFYGAFILLSDRIKSAIRFK